MLHDIIETIGFGWFFFIVVTSPFWVGLLGFGISEWRAHRRIRSRMHELSIEEMEKHIEWQMRPPRNFNPRPTRTPRPPPR